METQQIEIEQLKEQVRRLEARLAETETIINEAKPEYLPRKDWRSIVGVHANNPFFDEIVQAGIEWRNADRQIDPEPEPTPCP